MNDKKNSISGVLTYLMISLITNPQSLEINNLSEQKIRKCRRCGKDYIPKRYGHFMCYECFDAQKEHNPTFPPIMRIGYGLVEILNIHTIDFIITSY